jgi:hypothetical protein
VESRATPLIALTIGDPCTGEQIFFEGTQHIRSSSLEDGNGGFHVQGYIGLQAKGVSDSGANYVVHESLPTHYNFSVFVEGESNITFTTTYHFIRQGSDTPFDDYLLKSVNHATVNANGEVTSVVSEFEAECT